MNRPPSFPFYPDNWLGSESVKGMTLAEEGAYLRLLLLSWVAPEMDCGLPDNDDVLAYMSRLGDAWRNGSGQKIRACFESKDGRLRNPKLLQCWEKSLKYSESRRKNISSRYICRQTCSHISETETKTVSVGIGDRGKGGEPGGVGGAGGNGEMPPDGWSWEQVQAAATPIGVLPDVLKGYFDARTATGWIDGAKREVARTHRGLLADISKWKSEEPTRRAERERRTGLKPDNRVVVNEAQMREDIRKEKERDGRRIIAGKRS